MGEFWPFRPHFTAAYQSKEKPKLAVKRYKSATYTSLQILGKRRFLIPEENDDSEDSDEEENDIDRDEVFDGSDVDVTDSEDQKNGKNSNNEEEEENHAKLKACNSLESSNSVDSNLDEMDEIVEATLSLNNNVDRDRKTKKYKNIISNIKANAATKDPAKMRNEYFLNKDHTHFLLIDTGTSDNNHRTKKVINFRSKIEKFIVDKQIEQINEKGNFYYWVVG